MKKTNLRLVFEEIASKCGCENYYCTTCGGISFYCRDLMPSLEAELKACTIKEINFVDDDFSRNRQFGFPKEPECTQYVLFVRTIINHLTSVNQSDLMLNWVEQTQDLSNRIIDGIGYYLVPWHCKNIWKDVLIVRSENDKSIMETLNLKYGT